MSKKKEELIVDPTKQTNKVYNFANLHEYKSTSPKINYCHWSLELTEESNQEKNNATILPALFENALIAGKCSIVSSAIHIFPNGGLTLTFILKESSCAVHTWPENRIIFCSLETCAEDVNAQAFVDYLTNELSAYIKNHSQGTIT